MHSSSPDSSSKLNEAVRLYWESSPFGVSEEVVNGVPQRTREWFERTERARYEKEPFVPSVAQFASARGKKLLEIGVGAGVDHVQWARAGANCHGVDLTDAAIELTRARLETYELKSTLQRVDAEELPFPDNSFDMVYSWGVIHHSANPERIVAEIHRVLKPDGMFIGMMYGRHSLKAFTAWVYWAAIRGKPWRSFRDVLWNHVESPGTKAYTVGELKRMFNSFSAFSAQPIKTIYDTRVYPRWLHRFLPEKWGWFIALRATK